MPAAPLESNPEADESRAAKRLLWLIAVLAFVAVNLRFMPTSLGPVLDSVRQALQLSSSAAGLLGTLPVRCFGLIAPTVPRLLQRVSPENLVTLGMVLQATGLGLRSLFGIAGMYAGTLLCGLSIGMVMAVLPSLIKRYFPIQASAMMGVYSTALAIGAAGAAALAVPLEKLPGSDWRWSLAFWMIPVLLSAVAWHFVTLGKRRADAAARPQMTPVRLRGNWLAWQITLFMGTQSTIAYALFGWLAVILVDRGLSAMNAGFALSLMVFIQLITSLWAPWAAQRRRDQRGLIVLLAFPMWLGLLGMFFAPIEWIWACSLAAGLGLGGFFALSLAFLVLRSPSSQVTASLSSMAQCVGYIIASLGPIALGWLHEITENWFWGAMFFVVLMTITTSFGYSSSRNLTIKP
jgi:CP family cyanate transporter-like MFS transporter